MHRRTLLQALGATSLGAAGLGAGGLAAGGLAMPGLARAASETTLRFVPQIDLAFLDPHWTTADITRNHGYMVFDTLYGQDGQFRATPQMVEGHTTSQDGLLWQLRLRDGLLWHDLTPVLARDCVASITRWAKRDAFGEALMQATDQLDAPDDRTIRFRLKRPFPLLPDALGKCSPYMPAMMPERLARTDSSVQVTEMVGSGPFRFLADQRVPGSRNAYAKFERYVPRAEGTPDWTSGPKVVHFDRVVWTTIPDAATAAAALQAGEQDWWENADHDLMPLLRQDPHIRTEVLDRTGNVEMLRPNHVQPPFNNPEIRRALLGAIDQSEFMQAIVGNSPSDYNARLGIFCPDTPMASNAGLEPLEGKRDYPAVKAAIKAAGYNGEKVVLLVPTDYATLRALGDVTADMFRRVGLNVEYTAMDWGTMLQRRTNKGPVESGGWSCFVTGWAGIDWLNPAGHIAMRGNGAAGYPGWSVSPRTEALRQQWFTAPDLAAQQAICADIQRQCMIDVPYYPLGQFFQSTAYRTAITGVLKGFATFWNVRPA